MTNKYSWLTLLSGIIFVLLGFYILTNPVSNLITLGLIFSITMLFGGISEVVSYFSQNKEERNTWLLANGIITILLAIWLLSSSAGDIALLVPTVFAFWVLSSGITRIITGFKLRKTILKNTSISSGVLALGIVGTIFGLILLYNPGFTTIIITFVMSGLFIYQGIVSIILFFSLKK